MSATSPALRSPRLRLRLSHTFQQGVPKTRFAERPGMALGQRRWRLQPAADSAVWCTGRSVEQLKYSTTAAGQLTGTPTTLPLSPAVRYLIDSNALNPNLIPASGPHSRLLKGDVLLYLEGNRLGPDRAGDLPPSTPSIQSRPAPVQPPQRARLPQQDKPVHRPVESKQAKFTDIPVTDEHRVEAKASVQYKMSLPHSYASVQCHLGPLMSALDGRYTEGEKLSWLDAYLVKAAAMTLQQLPHSNAVWNGDNLYLLPSINVAMRFLCWGKLVSTPVISGADRMSVERIRSVIEAVRKGTYGSEDGPEEAALMLTSLSSSHLTHYTAIVQPPHSAVLSIAGLQRVYHLEAEASSVVASASLSCDSRMLNSDLASQWLQQFKTNVELAPALSINQTV